METSSICRVSFPCRQGPRLIGSTSAQRPSFAYQVDQAIQASLTTVQGSLQVSPNDPEDSDKWLEVSPDELDGMMQKASGASGSAVPGERAEVGDEHGRALGDLAKKVEEFIGGQGDVEGARFVEYAISPYDIQR